MAPHAVPAAAAAGAEGGVEGEEAGLGRGGAGARPVRGPVPVRPDLDLPGWRVDAGRVGRRLRVGRALLQVTIRDEPPIAAKGGR